VARSWGPSCKGKSRYVQEWYHLKKECVALAFSCFNFVFSFYLCTGQTIRDALHFQYRSSTKAKKKRRQTEQAKANANMTEISKAHLEISSKIDDLKSKVRETSKSHLRMLLSTIQSRKFIS
jgi:hypothetical protein